MESVFDANQLAEVTDVVPGQRYVDSAQKWFYAVTVDSNLKVEAE